MNEEQEKAMKAYDVAAESARALFRIRNAEYGNSIVYGGVVGAVTEFIGVVARLRQVLFTSEGQELSPERRKEILHDKLQDGLNYSIIALMMLEEGNLVGIEMTIPEGVGSRQHE